MAANVGSFFENNRVTRMHSPDDLDKNIHVTNVAVWLVLGLCLIAIIALLAWGVLGTVSTNVNATGVSSGGTTLCYLGPNDVARVQAGDPATINNTPARVKSIESVPTTRDEANELLHSDYLVSLMMEDDWAYAVTLEEDPAAHLTANMPLSVAISAESSSPISLVLGNQEQ